MVAERGGAGVDHDRSRADRSGSGRSRRRCRAGGRRGRARRDVVLLVDVVVVVVVLGADVVVAGDVVEVVVEDGVSSTFGVLPGVSGGPPRGRPGRAGCRADRSAPRPLRGEGPRREAPTGPAASSVAPPAAAELLNRRPAASGAAGGLHTGNTPDPLSPLLVPSVRVWPVTLEKNPPPIAMLGLVAYRHRMVTPAGPVQVTRTPGRHREGPSPTGPERRKVDVPCARAGTQPDPVVALLLVAVRK